MVDEAAQEGLWIIDGQNCTTYVNEALARMLGYRVEDMVGAQLFDFMDEEAQGIASVSLERRRQGVAEDIDFRYKHRDGSDVWAACSCTQVLGDDGEYLGALATLLDITGPRAEHQDLPLVLQIGLLAGAEDFEAAMRDMLAGLAGADSRWDYAEAWLPDVNHDEMSLDATWSRASGAAPGASAPRRFPAFRSLDYAQRVTAAGRPDWVDDCAALDGGAWASIGQDGPASMLAMPVKAGDQVVAVLLIFSTRPFPCEERHLRRIESLTSQLGPVLQRRHSEDRRIASDHRFREFIDHMPAVVYMKDLAGEVLLLNHAAEGAGVIGAHVSVTSTSGPNPHESDLEPVAQVAATNDAAVAVSGIPATFEESAERVDGTHWYSAVKFPVLDASGQVYAVGTIASDITDHKRANEDLEKAHRLLERRAFHDSLTGLANRARLLDRLRSLDPGLDSLVGLLFIDLDDFKDVNDIYGHAEGDDVLRSVAARMRRCVRPGDLLARLGGDEFAILLEGRDTAAAGVLAERIVLAMAAPFTVAGIPTPVTASIGIAVATIAHSSSDELLRFADLAMYEAKAQGKNRFANYDVAMSDAMTLRTRTARELRDAIERDELVLHYQPLLDLTSGRMVGVEALVRWEHPDRGLLGPDEFIALAERTGTIVDLGGWVLRTACQQASAWNAARPGESPLVMSVNVSARQLDDPSFLSTVADALEAAALDPTGLCLEITETAVMANPSAARQAAKALRSLGVGLALDDFGTGFASLTYLRHLHVTALKIDKSFVEGVDQDSEDTTIVTAVIGLAHAFGLAVIAEGVETTEQLDTLRDMGCQLAQGYLFSRPMPADRLTVQLQRRWFASPRPLTTPIGAVPPIPST